MRDRRLSLLIPTSPPLALGFVRALPVGAGGVRDLVEALLRAARDREAMGSALAR
jgi:hypothetical protein